MPEPFKNRFNETLVKQLAFHLKRVAPPLNTTRLTRHVKALDALELKQRSEWITDQLDAICPAGFKALDLLLRAILHPEEDAPLSEMKSDELGVRGWVIMPLGELVVRRGMDQPRDSLALLEAFTKRFSAEFAVRPFIEAHPKMAFAQLKRWARSDNEHVRRLASEGSRPRLPWGIRLQELVKDPAPILPVLELLKNDTSTYVRKSVANNLNDIAKDHPDTVVAVGERWLHEVVGKPDEKVRRGMVRHALRSLIKQGHPQALSLLGVSAPKVEVRSFVLKPKKVSLGGSVTLNITLQSTSNRAQSVVLDYAVFHQKKNGTKAAKVFKWKSFSLPAKGAVDLSKQHSLKPVTTRVYYNGEHDIELRINGKPYGKATFLLSGCDA